MGTSYWYTDWGMDTSCRNTDLGNGHEPPEHSLGEWARAAGTQTWEMGTSCRNKDLGNRHELPEQRLEERT